MDPSGVAFAPTLTAPAAPTPDTLPVVHVIEDRYQLLRKIGEGSFGDVWEARDRIVGERVAFKWLRTSRGAMEPRVRREIAILRLLRFSGVARLLDDGVADDRPFIVMELIDGKPFPGCLDKRSWAWADIVDSTLALLETLSHVHVAGVVHRDLKPANILVRPDGRPVVVDFGVSLPVAFGVDRRRRGGIPVGSPQYMSPEQISGGEVDARTDLYAVGVMLYELLTGHVPHDAKSIGQLFRQRLSTPVRPVQELAVSLPVVVASVINRLLATNKEERFDSAADVLAALRGEVMKAQPRLPFLGPREAIGEIVLELAAGHSVILEGMRGSGRTRWLQEVASLLEQQGRTVRWIHPSRVPLGSLVPVVGEPPGEFGLNEALAWATEALSRQSKGGVILLVDDAERLDPCSAAVLSSKSCRRGAMIRAYVAVPKHGASGKMVRIPLLEESALQALFVGPNRLFHLREDAARALFERTNGHPGQIEVEVFSWVRMGLARRVGPELAVDRDALERLHTGLVGAQVPMVENVDITREDEAVKEMLQWLSLANCPLSLVQLGQLTRQPSFRLEAMARDCARRGWIGTTARHEYQIRWRQTFLQNEDARRIVHHRIAFVLEPGDEMRLYHFVAAGLLNQAVEESLVAASKHATKGNTGMAMAMLAEGLRAAREVQAVADEKRILVSWAKAAFDNDSVQALDRVLYEISRTSTRLFDVELKRVETLLRAAIVAPSARGMQALDMVEELGSFADPEFERWRHRIRITAAASRASASWIADILHEVEDWVDQSDEPLAQLSLAEGRGRQRYHEGRFEDAAQWYERAAAFEVSVPARIAAMLRSASALLEAFRYAEAVKMARTAQTLAVRYRNPLWEARSEWILRSVQYRTGQTADVDFELIDVVKMVGTDDIEALVCLNEAAVAMRLDLRSVARDLAERAAVIWRSLGRHYASALAQALAIAHGAVVQQDEVETLIERALESTGPGIGIQTLGLLGRTFPGRCSTWARTDIERLCRGIPRKHWPKRMDVLSLDEARAWAFGGL